MKIHSDISQIHHLLYIYCFSAAAGKILLVAILRYFKYEVLLTSLLPLTPPIDLVLAYAGLVSSAAAAHKSVDIL